MRSWFVLGLILVGILASAKSVPAQTARFALRSSTDTAFVLPSPFIVASSLRVRLDSNTELSSPSDFRYDEATNSLLLTPQLRSLLWAGTPSDAIHTLIASYVPIPISLPRSHSLYRVEAIPASDSLLHGAAAKHVTTTEPTTEPLLSNFQRSGSISRGFQLGSNRDLALTSGFNLQFSGDLAQDVSVTGALSEESTPIQPEGTTQTLQDVDRIYITLKAGEHVHATLGDFYATLNAPRDIGAEYQSRSPLGLTTGRSDPFTQFSQSSFDVLNRKLLGAEATLAYNDASLTVLGASARGKHTTNNFQGQESFQGPYRLSGKNGERAILIVAGSERVYVDGQLQTRGERNDYIIDYSLGEIRFEPRRLITAESRIVVDFEYSDQQYSRSLVAGRAGGSLFGDRFQLAATYIREGDNPDVPLDLSLSDTDRSILAKAGNDPLAAARSGVRLVERSASGAARGSYVRVDSVMDGASSILYEYAPHDTVNAIFNVSFGYAGPRKGSYVRESIGQFTFVGRGLGDYDTLQYLPLPELDQILAFHGTGKIANNLAVTGEFATSAFDQNRLATLASLTGNAFRIGAIFADTLPLLGYAEIRVSERKVSSAFHPLDRTQDVELFRRYGNDAASETVTGSAEEVREASLIYRPFQRLQLDATYGSLDRAEMGFSSARTYTKAELFEDSSFLPHAVATFESIPTTDTGFGSRSNWTRAFAESSKTIGSRSFPLLIGGRAGYEQKLSHSTSTDSLQASSFQYRSIGPFTKLSISNWLSVSADATWRFDDSARAAIMTPISRALTQRASIALLNLSGFSSNVDVTLRNRTYSDSIARLRAGGDQRTTLLRFEPRYVLNGGGLAFDALYEISDQRSARLERVFLPVQAGYGSYKYLGDLNGNGKPDPNEFEIARYPNEATYILVTVPTEQLFPVTDLRTNARLRLAPTALFDITDSSTALLRALGSITSETFVRISETSTDDNPSDIYFLRLSHFLTPASTLKGSYDLEQDIGILESNPTHSYRLHFLERRNAGQYNTGLENTYIAERSLRMRLRPSYEFAGETTVRSGTDVAESDSLSLNRPHHTSLLGASTDWTYHPAGSAFDYSLRLEGGRADETSLVPTLSAVTNGITARTSYAFETQARLRAEVERDELTIRGTIPASYILPYALTAGRTIGVTWLWRLSLDYQFASGFVATLSYDGRNEAVGGVDRQTIHNARAEVRASF